MAVTHGVGRCSLSLVYQGPPEGLQPLDAIAAEQTRARQGYDGRHYIHGVRKGVGESDSPVLKQRSSGANLWSAADAGPKQFPSGSLGSFLASSTRDLSRELPGPAIGTSRAGPRACQSVLLTPWGVSQVRALTRDRAPDPREFQRKRQERCTAGRVMLGGQRRRTEAQLLGCAPRPAPTPARDSSVTPRT